MTQNQDFAPLVAAQQDYFQSHATRPVAFRVQMLHALEAAIRQREAQIIKALAADFGKPPFETFTTEIAILLSEIKTVRKQLAKWAKPRRVKPSLLNFPSSDSIVPEPLGVALIIGAWNYPFQLTLSPLVGAMAAGCCAVLKPSELTPHTSQLIVDLVSAHFPPGYLAVAQGGPEVSQALLELPFQKIFFTGSVPVGKLVAQVAAKQLIPVTLELGGKSPGIVDQTADLKIAAQRLAWGKFINAGQTCVAPDYLLVHRSVLAPFLQELKVTITAFYGPDPAQSPDYARIINDRHFARLQRLLEKETICHGGSADASTRYLGPTLLTGCTWQSPAMQEEIFGPILPVLPYDTLSEAIALINARPKPLALYFFSKDTRAHQRILAETSSGGVCLNDTISHLVNPRLPFGGVGESGQGNYHGKASFETFSHFKSVLKKPYWPDSTLRYPPYHQKLDWVRKAFKWL